jgi:hypothetical protein
MSITKYGASKDQVAKTASGENGTWSNVDPKADTEIIPAPKKPEPKTDEKTKE